MLPFLKKASIQLFSCYGNRKILFTALTLLVFNFGFGQDPISISDVTLSEGDAGTTNFVFTVSVDGGGNATNNIGFTVNTADGSATLADSDYVQISGGSGTITSGTPSTTVTVQVNGDTDVEGDEDFTVVLSAPVNATITDDTGLGTITNDDVAPLDAISISDVTLSEGDAGTTNFVFTVSVDGGGNATNNIGFTVNTADGSATLADSDYVQISGGSGTITSGTPSTTVTVQVNGDTDVEGDEDFTVVLSAPVNATITDDTGLGTITNDDVAPDPVATITATDGTATELGTTTGEYTVSLDVANSSGGAITVNYTVGGDATSGSDFVALAGSVDIPDTQQSATITLTPIDDSDVELDETVTVTLATGTGYTVGAPNSADVTITSDDVAPDPVATITATDGTATELGTTTGEYTVSLDVANSSGGA
ncbi:beta strand repeat-containing protein, partial [Flagellimonas sp. 2504JD1-5]